MALPGGGLQDSWDWATARGLRDLCKSCSLFKLRREEAAVVDKLMRKGKPRSKQTSVAVCVETRKKANELAEKQNTTSKEIIRFLVDLAHEGKIAFR